MDAGIMTILQRMGKTILRYISGTFGIFWLMISCVNAEQHPAVTDPLPLLLEIRMGLLAHDVDDVWSRSRKEDGVDVNGEIILNALNQKVLRGIVRPHTGVSINTSGDTNKLYAGLLWERLSPHRVLFNVGIGLALHDGELDTHDPDKKSLGSRVLFHIPFEAGYEVRPHYRIFLFFDHVSNAYLFHPNQGMDTLGVRVGYRF
jgi:hypothetical protein